MEPFEDREFGDKELKELLKHWKAPSTPPDLARGIRQRRATWRRWLITGSIRIPVPVGAAALVLLALWAYGRIAAPSFTVPEPTPVSFADFQPVVQLEPRVVGDIR
jgi:hypothetical protein